MTYREVTKAQLMVDEGVRKIPYLDTVGKWTAGVGRNLTDNGLRDNEISLMLDNDIDQAEKDARMLVKNFDDLSDNRKSVVLNMSFNLGFRRFSQFLETLRHINAREFEAASISMLDSAWAKQVGARATRLAKLMKEG